MRFGLLSCAAIVIVSTVTVSATAQNPLKQAIEKAKQEAEKKAAERKAEQQRQQQQQQGQRGPAGMPNAQAAGGQASAGTAQPLNAKVQETLMGPWVSGNQMSPLVLSEDGNHIAIATAKGSRQVMMIDGVEGPLFDEFPRSFGLTNIAVRFSPTGGHSAYLGRRGQDYIAVVDGKEATKIVSQQTMSGLNAMGSGSGIGFDFWFNNDGSNLAYGVVNDTGSLSMIVDGVKTPTYAALDLKQTQLKGNRLAYIAQTADKMWHVVVDGKVGPPYPEINSLMMTPDGAHYAYVATKVGVSMVVLDGVEGKGYRGINDLEMAPDGRVAYTAQPANIAAAAAARGALVVAAGQEIMNVISFGTFVPAGPSAQHYVAFAADGKGLAYVKSNAPSPGVVAVVNGKPSMEYANINNLRFSPDGKRYFFLASTASGTFPVVDGQEMPGVTGLTDFQFSPDGKRYAYRIWNSPRGFSVMVDGKEGPPYRSDVLGLRFSPDSKHVVYGAISVATLMGEQAIIDSEVKPGFVTSWVSMNQTLPPITFAPFVYSPDSSRLAYLGQKIDGTGKQAVVLDGTAYEGASASFGFPAFSSDSKHFAWINNTGKGWTVFIDQKIGPTYETIVQNVAGTRFVDNQTYRFYGIKDNQVYRVTVGF